MTITGASVQSQTKCTHKRETVPAKIATITIMLSQPRQVSDKIDSIRLKLEENLQVLLSSFKGTNAQYVLTGRELLCMAWHRYSKRISNCFVSFLCSSRILLITESDAKIGAYRNSASFDYMIAPLLYRRGRARYKSPKLGIRSARTRNSLWYSLHLPTHVYGGRVVSIIFSGIYPHERSHRQTREVTEAIRGHSTLLNNAGVFQ